MSVNRKHRWERFRDEVIELDGEKCVRCQKSREQGATLHVHHKEYIAGHEYWDYPPGMCETLCAGCHAKTHGILSPDFGWVLVGEEDSGSRTQNCDYCLNLIRHSFQIKHPTWGEMWVGTDCCDQLTQTDEGSRRLDKAQKYAARRKRFIDSPRWQFLDEGGYSITLSDVRVYIAQEAGGFRIFWNRRKGGLLYSSRDQARGIAFDKIESGEVQEYLRKPRRRV